MSPASVAGSQETKRNCDGDRRSRDWISVTPGPARRGSATTKSSCSRWPSRKSGTPPFTVRTGSPARDGWRRKSCVAEAALGHPSVLPFTSNDALRVHHVFLRRVPSEAYQTSSFRTGAIRSGPASPGLTAATRPPIVQRNACQNRGGSDIGAIEPSASDRPGLRQSRNAS